MSFYEVVFIAIALGMDSFSLSIGVGIAGTHKNEVFKLGLIIGVLHLILPLGGLYIGKSLGAYLGQFATYLGSGILILLGINIVREALISEETEPKLVGLGIVLLPLSVSLDSFTVGFGLGTLGVEAVQVALFLGSVAFLMTILGVTLGDRLGHLIDKADLIGGVILIILGIKMLIA